MVGKQKRMDQIRKVLKIYLEKGSFRGAERATGIMRKTIRNYVNHLASLDIPIRSLDRLSDYAVRQIFYGSRSNKLESRQVDFDNKVSYFTEELSRTGVTRFLLWKEYIATAPNGYGYSQFCRRLTAHIKSKNASIQIMHKAGEHVMVDFAGKRILWYDPISGERQYAQVLVGILPFSGYTIAVALPSQKLEDFIEGLQLIFEYFGGVPKVLLSDNLRSYVKKSDRYCPEFTDLCVQLASHYGVELAATRVAKPKDKASVENMVSTVYNRVYGPLRNKRFESIESINTAFLEQLAIHNKTNFQKKEGSRMTWFIEKEKYLLKSLPSSRFLLRKQTTAKIQSNYHAFLGEDRHFYSVPNKYIGSTVTILYTTKLVEIYHKGIRIAIHERIQQAIKGNFSTIKAHQPTSHQIYEQLQAFTDADYLQKADQIGKHTYWAIGYILTYQPQVSSSYASCLGILRLANTYSNERLEAACQKCKTAGQVNYRMLKNILKNNLDKDEIESTPPNIITEHENIRGVSNYY